MTIQQVGPRRRPRLPKKTRKPVGILTSFLKIP
jgi:hypothetical protein